jgi:hypothetical protein
MVYAVNIRPKKGNKNNTMGEFKSKSKGSKNKSMECLFYAEKIPNQTGRTSYLLEPITP